MHTEQAKVSTDQLDLETKGLAQEDLSSTSIPICDIGTAINVSLLQGKLVPAGLTEQMRIERSTYWLTHHPLELPSRANGWNIDFRTALAVAEKLGDSSDLPRSIYWSGANLKLLEAAQNTGIGVSDQLREAVELHEKADRLQAALPPDTTGIFLEQLVSSPHEYGLATGMEVDKYTFAVQLKGRNRDSFLPAEVNATSLNLTDPKKRYTVYCGPISIGCPAGCNMCDIGEFNSGQLRADQMSKMILTPMLIAGFPKENPDRARISWLGGGDPAYNMPEFIKAVQRVHEYFPISTQVVSTVGVSEQSLKHLLNLRRQIPQVSLQVSLLDTDPAIRQSLIRSRVMTPQKILSALNNDWNSSGKEGKRTYLSFMMYEGVSDDPTKIADMLAQMQVDPRSAHITLDLPTHVRDSGLQPASRERYEASLQHLFTNGYETHIYQTPQSFEVSTGCGVLSPQTRIRISDTLFRSTHSIGSENIPIYSGS